MTIQPELSLITDESGISRCAWGAQTSEYIEYHDTEWGVPIRDDRALFERLSLESFQSGLSWLTVLRKRDAFREVFQDFEPEIVANFDEAMIGQLLGDARIIRHRKKIESTVNNARALLAAWELHGHDWLTQTLLAHTPTERELSDLGWLRPPTQLSQIPPKTPHTQALSIHLKRAGFVFLGPTTLHAALQATGFINDHLIGCHRYESVDGCRQAQK